MTTQIPKKYGGIESHVLFADTEHTFRPERLKQIAQAFVELVRERHPQDRDESFSVQSVMENVNLVIIREPGQLIALIQFQLEELLANKPKAGNFLIYLFDI